MSRERTLDEFLDQTTPSNHDAPEIDDEIKEVRSVMEFSPSGAVCALCGDETHRRWREDESEREQVTEKDEWFVCRSCKSW